MRRRNSFGNQLNGEGGWGKFFLQLLCMFLKLRFCNATELSTIVKHFPKRTDFSSFPVALRLIIFPSKILKQSCR